MGSNHFGKVRSKKGTTMVEVIAAVLILAIVVVGVLTTISFSQRTILSGSIQGKASAQAQTIADALIAELNSADALTVAAKNIVGAVYVDKNEFPKQTIDKQFTIISVTDMYDTTKVEGYQIKTAVYFTDSTGRKCVQMTAFAAKGGAAP